MTVALGACLLNDKGVLESTITYMIADEDSTIRAFSSHVSSIIEEAITHGVGRGRETYNCMIGWSQCPDHPQIEEVMSTADAGLLLALLWGDREQFFRVMSTTISPGLCGLVYVLWRYVIYKRQCRELSGPEAKRLKVQYTDILWRSHLSTTLDQHKAYYLLHSLNSQGLKLWEENPKYINLEDSKLIVRLIGHQMLRLTGVIAPENFPNALSYAYHHSIRFVGCEDVLLDLFGGTFKQLWDLMEDLQDNKETIIGIICEVFDWLSKILICFATRCFDHSNLYNIVYLLSTELIHILDLIAKIMFFPDPKMAGMSPDALSHNRKFLIASSRLCICLSKTVSRDSLLEWFWPYYLDWQRYYRHLEFNRYLAAESPDLRNYYVQCIQAWMTIWESLGRRPETGMDCCMYLRCADPCIPRGTGFTCERCTDNLYCGSRCQASDWVSNETSKEICSHHTASFFAEWEGMRGYGFKS
ncbi:unnamed protein product [Rhizoctonia solani]|nr:unnamed protein product [Rhizoctonia solani]